MKELSMKPLLGLLDMSTDSNAIKVYDPGTAVVVANVKSYSVSLEKLENTDQRY